jgi:hypothetical protein
MGGIHGHAAGRRHTSRAKYGAINVFGEFALAPEEEWRDMVADDNFTVRYVEEVRGGISISCEMHLTF